MNATIHQTMTCDVLVIGGGGAGVRAALTAAETIENVLLISETPIGGSGSTFYPLTFEWGMLSAVDDEDAKGFTQEILAASKGCVNPRLAAYLAEGSKEAHDRFLAEGLPFTPMRDLNITGCFGKNPRGDFLTDMEVFVRSQREMVERNERIVFAELTAVSLLIKEGCCVGAMTVDGEGQLIQVNAGAVVMALGGGEGLYQHRAAYGPLYGNAYAMAARHQARIVNLEFVQFVPGTLEPMKFMNYFPFLLGEHPRVTNARNEECMSGYLPEGMTVEESLDMHAKHGPFTCEDAGRYLEYAMVGEGKKGNGKGLKLWPDPSRMQDPRVFHWRNFLKRYGYDEGTVMTVYPMAQGFNGGILLNDDLSTDIPGLYACGESSGGMHGPDRMGGLCILATQVFGKGAGRAAGRYAREAHAGFVSPAEALEQLCAEFANGEESALSPSEVLDRIREIMQENACLRRNENKLNHGINCVEQLHLNPLKHLNRRGAAAYFQAANALDACRLILTAMRNRRESRGSHDRDDYAGQNPALKNMQWVSIEKNHLTQGTVTL